jgi:two-component system, OmpR family, sensor histidine kinase MprB
MTFRTRLTLVAGIAVAVAVALSSLVTYALVGREVRGEIDNRLRARAERIAESRFGVGKLADLPPPRIGAPSGYVQLVQAKPKGKWKVSRTSNERVPLPVTRRVLAVARGEAGPFFFDATVAGERVRVFTTLTDKDVALELSRSLSEVDRTMERVRLLLILVTFGGVGIALALGLFVSGAALAPVRRLTEAAEHVAATRNLGRRIDERGHDELSRLAGSFNTMLEALERAARSRRQLVADASHELRTPLTSMRTNIEVLARDGDMPASERKALMRDVVEQLGEMTTLVSELVELARGERQAADAEDVRLDEVVAAAVERARRNAPRVEFDTALEESVVHGVPSTIDRAVTNLLDNAAKWSPPDGVVDVAVRNGEVVVRDRGPGIDEADLPHVFERFYRAPAARRLPGSGLGLAIVRQVAESHGGEAVAVRAEGGGTELHLRFPPNGSSNGGDGGRS